MHKRLAFNNKRKRKKCLVVGSWNVHTLVSQLVMKEFVGEKSTGRNTQGEGSGDINRKLDLVVRELKKYGVTVAEFQESKWFENDVWQADGYTILQSGWPIPSDNDKATKMRMLE